VAVDRRSVNQWQVFEAPLALSGWGFRRDDGQDTLTVGGGDRFDAIRVQARQQDIFGDGRPVLAIDDVQVVVKD
jgi:hypothetical protein